MSNSLWWVNPSGLLVLLILPLFVLSAFLGAPLMPQFGSADFLTPGAIVLGAACICSMAIGAVVGTAATDRLDVRPLAFDDQRFDQLLVVLLWLCVTVHLIFLGRLLSNPSLMWDVLTAEKGAIFHAREALTFATGITSLTNITPLALCMCSVRLVTRGRLFPTRNAAAALAILSLLIFIHAFIGAERLVLVENAIGLLLPIFTFSRRFKMAGQFAPLVGIVVVLIIFAAGEYTRSWPYYRYEYDSFEQFASLRLLAYIAGASNTGAGLVITMPPAGVPIMTERWITKIPAIISVDTGYIRQYFTEFGNVEFNNPSGTFAAIVDFGVPIGLLYLFGMGLLIGVIYGSYKLAHPVGLLSYPMFYMGLAELTQGWYWGEPRFIPQLLFLGLVVAVCVRRRVILRPA